ncbi:radial spoke head 1 homolog [Cimex lectularius]|uniref:Radial spoke head 1 homolog n=1 Tax=Cimex lectularius TaxID=79782 RepID=A0A8I6THE6_CIMLE|nr:radial spoke head 1 homolog [Cimex lectularius]
MADLLGEAGEGEQGPENIIGEYEGERNALQERHGLGRAILPNRDYYEGQYRKGLRHGLGLYVFKSGARYNGHYHKGIKQGIGTFYYPDGTRYEGEWKRDLRHGYGAYYYANGDIYEGQWKNGVREGLGSYTYKGLAVKFMGTWRNGEMDGPGQIITHAHRYHGVWKKNLPIGNGCFTFKTNCMQHGHHIHMNYPLFETTELFKKQLMPMLDPLKEEEAKEVAAIWRAREISTYDPERLPPAPVPFEYPPSDTSITPPPTPMHEEPVCPYDFFQDIAQYNKYYLDEKVIMATGQWEQKPKEPSAVQEVMGEGTKEEDEDQDIDPRY